MHRQTKSKSAREFLYDAVPGELGRNELLFEVLPGRGVVFSGGASFAGWRLRQASFFAFLFFFCPSSTRVSVVFECEGSLSLSASVSTSHEHQAVNVKQ